jgi:hypothetical protein
MQECLLVLSKAEDLDERLLRDLKKKLGFERDFWPIHACKISECGEDFFEPAELSEIKRAGYGWLVQIDCYLDEVERMRPILRAILIEVEGEVMYSSFSERYTPDELDHFKPSLED